MELWKPVPALGEHGEQADGLSQEVGLAFVLDLAISYSKIRPQTPQSEPDQVVEGNLTVDLRREAISIV